ncbi:MAG: hemolysin family protein [Bacteroidota bacterium]
MELFAIFVFLLLSALFSGTEIAFISASKLRVELKKKKGSRSGTILANFYEKPAEFLATMLVGNNIALVIFTTLASKPLEHLFIDHYSLFAESSPALLLINTVLLTIIVLIFGEFLPKTFFSLFADQLLYFLAIPIRILQFLLLVPSLMMTSLSNFVLRIFFKTPVEEVQNVITRLDLENFIKDTRIESEEEIDTNLFEKALHLKKVKVRECMVPRTEVAAIDVGATVGELRQVFMDSAHSRIIVINGDIENVMGYVHHQQLLDEPTSIEKIIMDIPIVPEVMRVRALMNLFIKKRINIACVVDEFGGTAGIITLEDILEEIFGEIEDEHDQEEYIETIVEEGEYLFSGRLEISYLNEKYEDLQFPEGDYHTLSGYLVMTTTTIPEQGAVIELDGYRFGLELVSDTKIELIRVTKQIESDEEVDQ